MEIAANETQLKEAIKAALVEVLQERQDLLYDAIERAFEDIALAPRNRRRGKNGIDRTRRSIWHPRGPGVNVQFKASFAKDLRNIKNKDLLNRVKEAIEQIEKAPSFTEHRQHQETKRWR